MEVQHNNHNYHRAALKSYLQALDFEQDELKIYLVHSLRSYNIHSIPQPTKEEIWDQIMLTAALRGNEKMLPGMS